MTPDLPTLRSFAERYTAAWCSHDPAQVAACYAPNGSLTINGGVPSVGSKAIAEATQGFFNAFPDIKVFMDNISVQGETARFDWTFTGTNTGPGGSGNKVRISGFEIWKIGADGLIAESRGHFDTADYERQLGYG
jgi:uncharacterized protein (TIGR02246 family)